MTAADGLWLPPRTASKYAATTFIFLGIYTVSVTLAITVTIQNEKRRKPERDLEQVTMQRVNGEF